jgi:amino acid permease
MDREGNGSEGGGFDEGETELPVVWDCLHTSVGAGAYFFTIRSDPFGFLSIFSTFARLFPLVVFMCVCFLE